MNYRIATRGCLILLALCLVMTAAEAQVPEGMNYQGSLTDENGVPLATGQYYLKFSVWNQPVNGALHWGFQTSTVDVVDGYFNVILGPPDGPSIGYVFKDPERYLEISVSTDGTVFNPILPRQQVLSAPTAFAAGSLTGAVSTSDPSATRGILNVLDNQNQVRGEVFTESGGYGTLRVRGPNGSYNASASRGSFSTNEGKVAVYNSSSQVRAEMQSWDGAGIVRVFGANGSENALIKSEGGNRGFISVHDSAGAYRGQFWVVEDGYGVLANFGPNGSYNFSAGSPTGPGGSPDKGLACVYGTSGEFGGCLTVGGFLGEEILSVTDHPTRSGNKIAYAALSGPEKAIFLRGKIVLNEGRATIDMPEHFAASAAPGTVTVSLTPHSLDSKGVGVGSIARDSIEIGEFFAGTGSYEVSYVVQATRHDGLDFQAELSGAEYESKYGLALPEVPSATSAPDSATRDSVSMSTLNERN